MNCDGCLVGPNQFMLKRNYDVSSDIHRGNVMKRDAVGVIYDATQKIQGSCTHSQHRFKGHVRSNKHEVKPDSADATMLLNSFPLCVMSLKCKCQYFACILSLSRPFQEITTTLWQEVTGQERSDVMSFSSDFDKNTCGDTQNVTFVLKRKVWIICCWLACPQFGEADRYSSIALPWTGWSSLTYCCLDRFVCLCDFGEPELYPFRKLRPHTNTNKLADQGSGRPASLVFCKVKLLAMKYGWFGDSNIWLI